MRSHELPVELFSTCPPSDPAAETYRADVERVARWSEEAGCTGILVYSDNRLFDPWLVSQIILQATRTLSPLVAVQPAYMHPYCAAKMVATLGRLYGRRLHLNLVNGGFKNDLLALADETPHDRRYARLVEYAWIVSRLLAGGAPVSIDGEFYRVDGLRLAPPLAPELAPPLFVSGSSEAGRAAAEALGALPVIYPGPAAEVAPAPDTGGGIRVGIVARESDEEAWRVARARFPGDRKGQLTHRLAMKVSDSVWHQELSQRAAANTAGENASPYWLFPFENYRTMCPYLVGSYEVVGRELARYAALGYGTVILDVPASREELDHTRAALQVHLESAA